MSVPTLAKQNEKTVLMVKDKPFILLAGELHNSNSSTAAAMDASCKKAVELGMNSVIATLSWEMIEPVEGQFDFSTVDMVIGKAREYGLKLELIWFGTWKNAQCSYAPEWVKKDLVRFPRAQMENGKNFMQVPLSFGKMAYSTISYLSENACKADAKALRAVMEHIKAIDSEENTVLMIQVENETGVLGAAREQSDLANERFAEKAPDMLVSYLKAHTENMAEDVREAVENGADSGTWTECFGPAAEEIFSAYHVSSYVNFVASEGKKAYDIPMSANCWLAQGKPGEYPSGGPVARMMEVWQCCAPSIDIFAPDIYIPAFCDVCDEFTKNGNPLFIPEIATHAYAGVRQLYAVGHHHAVCYAPFGFEDIGQAFHGMDGVGMDMTDSALNTRQDSAEYRAITSNLVSLMDKLGEKFGTADLDAVTSELNKEAELTFGDFGFAFRMELPGSKARPGGALVLKEAEDTFYILCTNCAFTPFSADPEKPYWDYIDAEEGYFEDGTWHTTLRRNGDEIFAMNFAKPTLLKIKLFAYC